VKCFVIMPFAESFDPVFETVKDVASETVGEGNFECYWLKDVHAAGRITDDIVDGLAEATFCIADLSGDNPNVMWETGFAMALDKPTILIGQDVTSLPFDLRSHRVLEYSPNALPDLRPTLAKAIQDTLSRYELKGTARPSQRAPGKTEQMTIAATGTMRANEAVARKRIEAVLTPHLSETTSWLVGCVGVVDVACARFLLDHQQQVTAVGLNRFYCNRELRPAIEEGTLEFLDVSLESLPKGFTGPTELEIFFCMKSDLIILLWDGESRGTKRMVDYYQDQGVSTLLAFI
jgi:hypothetical protein